MKRANGGKATVENGALLSAENHEWFNRQSKEKQRELNNAFQDYKHKIDIHCATLVFKDKELHIEPVQKTEEIIELPPEIETGIIEVEPMTEEEQAQYEEYKRQRKARQYKKFAYNEALDIHKKRQKAVIDEEWQKEIIQDIIDELRY